MQFAIYLSMYICIYIHLYRLHYYLHILYMAGPLLFRAKLHLKVALPNLKRFEIPTFVSQGSLIFFLFNVIYFFYVIVEEI